MPHLEELYFDLFNAVADALRQLKEQNFGTAAEILRQARLKVEERYMDAP